MRNFLFVVVLFLCSCASIKIQPESFFQQRNRSSHYSVFDSISNNKISLNDIKKTVKNTNKALEDDCLMLKKEFPNEYFLSVYALVVEEHISIKNSDIKKLKVEYITGNSQIVEEYYFNNNKLIAFFTMEYKDEKFYQHERGYLRDYKNLYLWINFKASKQTDETSTIIKQRIDSDIRVYVKFLMKWETFCFELRSLFCKLKNLKKLWKNYCLFY